MQSLEYLKQPLMPTDYGKRLTPAELNDLVSFLMDQDTSSTTPNAARSEDNNQQPCGEGRLGRPSEGEVERQPSQTLLQRQYD